MKRCTSEIRHWFLIEIIRVVQRAEFKYIHIYIRTWRANLLAITERKYFLLKTPSRLQNRHISTSGTRRRAGGCYGLLSTSRTRNIRGITCTTIISISYKVFFVEPATRRQLKLDLSALHHQPVDDALSYSVRNNGPWYTSNCAWMGNCEAESLYCAAALTHSWRNSAFVYRTKLRAVQLLSHKDRNDLLTCEETQEYENNLVGKELESLALQRCFSKLEFFDYLLLRRAQPRLATIFISNRKWGAINYCKCPPLGRGKMV